MKITDEDVVLAEKRAAHKKAHYPQTINVRYDRRIGKLVVELDNGLGLMMSLKDLQGLEHAKPDDLDGVEISPSGFGIYFPKIDVDLYVPGLIEGYLGTKRWMAAKNGRAGGKVSTEAKASAARSNGKLGGRPKKQKAEELLAA